MKYDMIAVGGGLTGAAAAVSAARQGMKTLLIEKSGFLGGAACNCLVNPFMVYTGEIDGKTELISDGIFREILDRLQTLGGLHRNKVTFNEELLKVVLDNMCMETGVDVLFHSYLSGAVCKDGKLESVSVVNKSGTQSYEANFFVDATGDADLAVMAGCVYQIGRESDNLCQPMTLCFRLVDVDVDTVFQNHDKINALYAQFQKEGKITNPRENVLKFIHMSDGVLHLNSTRIIKKSSVNAKDLSDSEIEGRRQMMELFTFLKENCAGFEQAQILSSAADIGVRESRMIKGKYTITEQDLLNLTVFDDAIAACRYSIDIHSPDGSGTYLHEFKEDEYYTIPYRCLVPKDGAENLLAAGRCISATHEAQSSLRTMPTCACMGQAAGIAAALAVQDGVSAAEVDTKKLRKILQEHNAFVGKTREQ
ncbi:MAG: FAD-dependent oxidoreductase [Clostridia bacterium]|nr:FAD-dependent oxidoreductase [Clostridia bacterium]